MNPTNPLGGPVFVLLLTAACTVPDRSVIRVGTVYEDTVVDPPKKKPDPTDTTTTTTTVITVPPDPDGPDLRSVLVDVAEQDLWVTFDTRPGDAPLEGGTVLVYRDGVPYEFAIPSDLEDFDGRVGIAVVPRPDETGTCHSAANHQIVVEVVDRAERTSGTTATQVFAPPVGLILAEIGDTTADILGTLTTLRLCGGLYRTGNDGIIHTADRDLMMFEVNPSQTWSFQLDWEAVGDYDLLLYEVTQPNNTLVYIDGADSPNLAGPEQIRWNLTRTVPYAVMVAGWSGAGGDWTLDVVP